MKYANRTNWNHKIHPKIWTFTTSGHYRCFRFKIWNILQSMVLYYTGDNAFDISYHLSDGVF